MLALSFWAAPLRTVQWDSPMGQIFTLPLKFSTVAFILVPHEPSKKFYTLTPKKLVGGSFFLAFFFLQKEECLGNNYFFSAVFSTLSLQKL